MIKLWIELKLILRGLWRNPGFTVIAVATLALCIGANSAIFNVVDKALLQGLPYSEPQQLAMLWVDATGQDLPAQEWTNPADFYDWQEQLQTVDSMFALTGWQPTLTGQSEPGSVPEMFQGQFVTADFLKVFGVQPQLGRSFTAAEDIPNGPAVVLISHNFWQRQLGGREDVINHSIVLNEQSHTIVGVLPADLQLPNLVTGDLFKPLQAEPQQGRGGFFLRVIARLKPEFSIEQAQSEFAAVQAQLAQAYPETNEGLGANIQSLQAALTGNQRPQLLALLGAALFVLLIGCANLSNLLLVRASSRSQEFSIRVALGAGRKDVTRRVLLECLVLGILGSIAGVICALLLSGWVSDMFASASGLAVMPDQISSLGWRLPLFIIGITLLVPMLAGLAPAMLLLRSNIHSGIRSISRGATSGRSNIRLSHLLVAVNFALALALCVAGGLLVKSFNRLQSTDLGFQPEHLSSFNINLTADRYESDQRRDFHTEMQARLQAIPGVQEVTFASTLPLSNVFTDTGFSIEGQDIPHVSEQPHAGFSIVAPNYHQVLGISLLRGSGFSETVTTDSELEILVNQALVKRYFPDGDVLGKRVFFGSQEQPLWARVVGEVNDIRFAGLDQPQQPTLYISQNQRPGNAIFVVINSQIPVASLLPQLRQTISEIDGSVAVANLTSMDQLVRSSLAQTRYLTGLVSGFAVLAVCMAAIGIYGVIAYLVNRRRRELGVRAVLGASPGKLILQVIQTGLKLAGIGGVAGVLLALLVGRLVQQLLYEVQPFDGAVLMLATTSLLLATLLACAVPAWRAGAVDPMVALRSE